MRKSLTIPASELGFEVGIGEALGAAVGHVGRKLSFAGDHLSETGAIVANV